MKEAIKKLVLIVTEVLFPITFLAVIWIKICKKAGFGKMSDKVFMKLGILPITDHYYQPLINPKKHLKKPLNEERKLPGLDFNIEEQIKILSTFSFNQELLKLPVNKTEKLEYYYNNPSYGSGDGEYLYNMIRHFKPSRVIEIGSGMSTLMAQRALEKNREEGVRKDFKHICIEPYEMEWLEQIGVDVKRELVEDISQDYFQQLEENDILFIDSSHVIRPQGDVLFEFQQILTTIKSGVIVHFHDIFTPRDYPKEWLVKEHRLWNEQYLLEVFLTFNKQFRIIGAVNFLSHQYNQKFSEKCPIYAKQPGREPGAFWMIKN